MITSLSATENVRVWKLKIVGRVAEWVVKWTPPSRLVTAAPQVRPGQSSSSSPARQQTAGRADLDGSVSFVCAHQYMPATL